MDRWEALRNAIEKLRMEIPDLVFRLIDDPDSHYEIAVLKGKRNAIDEISHEMDVLEHPTEPKGERNPSARRQ